MRKFIFALFITMSVFILIGCRKIEDITEDTPKKVPELIINQAPETYYEVNTEVDASNIKVKLKINGDEQILPLTDSKLTVTGLVDGKLDTTSVGEKTITVKYDTATLTISYQVADKLVNDFTEFKTAIEEVQGLIVLMDNIAVETSETGLIVPKDHVKTLELNGHTLSFTTSYEGTTALITNLGTLIIQDNTDIKKDGTGSGINTNKALNPDDDWKDEDPNHPYPTYANNTITNRGTLIVESGRIENTTGGGATYPIDNNSTTSDAIVYIRGGAIIQPKDAAIRLYANSSQYENVVNVINGVIDGSRGIMIHAHGKAELNISNGYVRGTDPTYKLVIYSWTQTYGFKDTKITITGGKFDGNVYFTGGSNKTIPETVSITGGEFLGEVASYGTMAPFITGGKFKVDPSDYVDLTTHEVKQVEEEYVVIPKSE
ncbi:MAG: hypothetical protein GX490_10035 [Bacilli bacterium]|nr:hypothetical protein [Bacilli bacterium]